MKTLLISCCLLASGERLYSPSELHILKCMRMTEIYAMEETSINHYNVREYCTEMLKEPDPERSIVTFHEE